jgi:hypothetical protein
MSAQIAVLVVEDETLIRMTLSTNWQTRAMRSSRRVPQTMRSPSLKQSLPSGYSSPISICPAPWTD